MLKETVRCVGSSLSSVFIRKDKLATHPCLFSDRLKLNTFVYIVWHLTNSVHLLLYRTSLFFPQQRIIALPSPGEETGQIVPAKWAASVGRNKESSLITSVTITIQHM